MIVRILGDGQYVVPEASLNRLNTLDAALQAAVDTTDEAAFADRLGQLLDAVRETGSRVPDAALTPSELVLPAADCRLADVVALMGDDGLIPG